MELILASSSPRRKEILNKFNYSFKVIPSNSDEVMDKKLNVYDNVLNVSYKKAISVFKDHLDSIVLSCDTIVALDGVIYGKPKDKNDAFKMLKSLNNKTHEVISACTILYKDLEYKFYDISYVTFKNNSDSEIEKYIDTKEPMDKAGSYAIQGIGKCLIKDYKGSLYNIIGLPIEKVKPILDELIGE
jgi:septum formation protein